MNMSFKTLVWISFRRQRHIDRFLHGLNNKCQYGLTKVVNTTHFGHTRNIIRIKDTVSDLLVWSLGLRKLKENSMCSSYLMLNAESTINKNIRTASPPHKKVKPSFYHVSFVPLNCLIFLDMIQL